MGTRADFYVGRGAGAEWLGSVGWDGYPEGLFSKPWPIEWTEGEWREWVRSLADHRRDFTSPDQGWPWPWDDSRTTDYAYAYEDGTVWASPFGRSWLRLDVEAEEHPERVKDAVFPNMTARQAVTLGPRSGLSIIGG